jgi:exodeoxyribonuclease V alpha subunit
MQHYTMLQRNLLYTGVTRGKRLVVLVGQKKGPSGGTDVDRLGSALMEAIDRLLKAEAIAQGRSTVLGLH